MNTNAVRTWALWLAFCLGLGALLWVGRGFIGSSGVALGVTALMLAAYLAAAWELRQFVGLTDGLAKALAQIPDGLTALDDWLSSVPQALQVTVRQRITGDRVVWPGLGLTPYVIGLLVMLGMLGTFLGMVVTFKGAVFALEGSADLQAIRAALAAPIKGLGLAFGTSVAGVASSAMLGWMAASVKRQRVQVLRALDARVATTFYPFTVAHQRQASFAASQAQAQALPEVVTQLNALITRIDSRAQQLDAQLLERQSAFHREASAAYTGLGESVARALQEAISTSTRVATETLQPVVSAAMERVAQESLRLHSQASDVVQQQLSGLSAQFSAATASVTETWAQALQAQTQTNAQLVGDLQQALGGVSAQLDARGAALVSALGEALVQAQQQHSTAHAEQRDAWAHLADTQSTRSEQMLTGLGQALERFTARIAEQGSGLLAQLDAALVQHQSAQAQADQAQQLAWQDAQQTQAQSQGQLLEQLASALNAFNASFEQASATSLERITQALTAMQTAQAEIEQGQQAAWAEALSAMSQDLKTQWQQLSGEHLAQQQAAALSLTQAAEALQAGAGAQASQVQQEIAQLLDTSQALVAARTEAEAMWMQQQGQRMDELAAVWRSELAALRDSEQARGESATARLSAWQDQLSAQLQTLNDTQTQRTEAAITQLDRLQTSMATQLANLGEALEAPMTRLLATASDAPKAAAEVIAQLRQDMSQLSERDNLALQERAELMQQMGDLVQGVQQATTEQRDAMEAMVRATSGVLNQVSEQFSTSLGAQVSHTDGLAAQVAGSAAELAALGEAFHQGVQLFSSSNTALVERLGQIEQAIQSSMTRSDEQLAYYVAQAREVIDLSISAQQGIVEDLRRLRGVSATAGGAA